MGRTDLWNFAEASTVLLLIECTTGIKVFFKLFVNYNKKVSLLKLLR